MAAHWSDHARLATGTDRVDVITDVDPDLWIERARNLPAYMAERSGNNSEMLDTLTEAMKGSVVILVPIILGVTLISDAEQVPSDVVAPPELPRHGFLYLYDTEGEVDAILAWGHNKVGRYYSSGVLDLTGDSGSQTINLSPHRIAALLALASDPASCMSLAPVADTGVTILHYVEPSSEVSQASLDGLEPFRLDARMMPVLHRRITSQTNIVLDQEPLWWVDDDMAAVLWDTVLSGTTPEDVLSEQLPATAGLMMINGGSGLPIPFVPIYGPLANTVQHFTVNAVLWHPRGGSTVFAPLVGRTRATGMFPDPIGNEPLILTPAITTDWVQRHFTGMLPHDMGNLSELLVKTALRLSREALLAEAVRYEPRQNRAALKRRRQVTPDHPVMLARLRRARVQAREELIDAEGREYAQRWIVRGHNRRQRIGSRTAEEPQFRNVWIAPYVKGPVDKPLVIKDKVNVWRR